MLPVWFRHMIAIWAVADNTAFYQDSSAIGSRHKVLYRINYGNRNSSVDTVTVQRNGQTKKHISIHGSSSKSSPNLSDRSWSPSRLLFNSGMGLFPGGKTAETRSWLFTPSNSEVKIARSFTTIHLFVS
jgi:hypothetical protein